MSWFSRPLPVVAPVPPAGLDDHFRAALAANRRMARRERSYVLGVAALAAGLAVACGYLLYRNEKLVELAAANALRVVYVYTREDGSQVHSAAYSSLPVKFQTDNTLNSLWNYVWWRECWNPAEAPRAFVNVQRMSDERVGKEWREVMANSNKLAPQNRLGPRGAYYTCEPIAYAPVGSDNDRYEFRFLRREVDRGRPDQGISMHVTVAYRTGVYPDDEYGWIDRTVFNAPGIQVWSYPGARPDAVQQHLITQNGRPP
ncbi:VirB8/TrbF family protein [Paracraurococcus lichenis]|uniref:VirB8/TrbF family protein n=1 Tax=Paracraurococcus lichenis TaxID=3064888 RepID=A0ABT9EAP0_9PROT|nr:VirB8/TrbF family protein [Paracraurococcus sp. LOR1-02]MDO9713256.1 VirB8/TrbF family protein [Paracraurococcus sp. LOR1-02]